jgi:hypothetical protein
MPYDEGSFSEGALFNADSAFDTKEVRKVCFNHQAVPFWSGFTSGTLISWQGIISPLP